MKLTIVLGSDHAGFELKTSLKAWLTANNFEVEDFGVETAAPADYPDIAHPVSRRVSDDSNSLGILLCGSGNGVAIAANKHPDIRAAICWTAELADLARRHNNANILCLPARFITEEEAKGIVSSFLNTAFEGGRHQRRVSKINC